MSEIITEMMMGMPYGWYEQNPGLRMSALKEINRSPQHFQHALAHPKSSKPLSLGKAAHVAVLEPERFSAEHSVWRVRTSSGSLAARNPKHKKYKDFMAESAARTIITEDEETAALAIQQAVRGNSDAMRYLASGEAEVTLLWPMHGRQCKGRVDWLAIIDGGTVIVGLKTARNCTLYPFSTAAAKLLYHLQWAWYFDGFNTITGEIARVVEIVVESEPPHAVVVYSIPDEVIQQGREEYLRLIEQLDECERAGVWPGPAPGEVLFSLPTWAYRNEDLSDLGLEA